MKEKLLAYLSCSSCSGAFELQNVTAVEGKEIIAGELVCRECGSRFPILRGVPRFASLEKVTADKAATAENFGWQWQHFIQAEDLYDEQFLGWIAPVYS